MRRTYGWISLWGPSWTLIYSTPFSLWRNTWQNINIYMFLFDTTSIPGSAKLSSYACCLLSALGPTWELTYSKLLTFWYSRENIFQNISICMTLSDTELSQNSAKLSLYACWIFTAFGSNMITKLFQINHFSCLREHISQTISTWMSVSDRILSPKNAKLSLYACCLISKLWANLIPTWTHNWNLKIHDSDDLIYIHIHILWTCRCDDYIYI